MKTKLLKRIRREARDSIQVYSLTRENGTTVGACFGCPKGGHWDDLFSIGDEKEDLLRKGANIWIRVNLDTIRKKYAKYSINFKRNENSK